MKNFSDIIQITEAILNPKSLVIRPVKLSKSNIGVDYACTIGNVFNIKDTKYCEMVERNL